MDEIVNNRGTKQNRELSVASYSAYPSKYLTSRTQSIAKRQLTAASSRIVSELEDIVQAYPSLSMSMLECTIFLELVVSRMISTQNRVRSSGSLFHILRCGTNF